MMREAVGVAGVEVVAKARGRAAGAAGAGAAWQEALGGKQGPGNYHHDKVQFRLA